MDPKELIAALGTLADPNASDEDKAAALDKLSAYFNSLLDSQETTEQTSDTSEETTETTSETGGGEDDDKPSKEMASALATIKALTDRVAKLEKASAVGNATRSTKPTIIPREVPTEPTDPVLKMIKAAGENTRRNASK